MGGRRLIDLTGKTFGKWKVVSFIVGSSVMGKSEWLCKCECGNERNVIGARLKNGTSKSCGCLRYVVNETQHLNSKAGNQTPEYKTWAQMKTRCYNPNSIGFEHWGGRGVSVCDRWKSSFINFLADMGPKPSPNHSLDRWPDVNGNYGPSNCRWATKKQQANNCTSNKYIEYKGRTQSLSSWCDELGFSPPVVGARLRKGWTIEEAFETPNFRNNRKGCIRGRKNRNLKLCQE